MRLHDLKEKDVINMQTCCKIGTVYDIEFDIKSGDVLSIILPGPSKFCFFGYDCEYIIPWNCICQIGPDIILVNVDQEKCRHPL